MKLKDVKKYYKIYVDLDGVLVDFETTAQDITGITVAGADKKQMNKFWKHIERHVEDGGEFFARMKPLRDAMRLWQFLTKHHPTILSATGHIKGAATEKRNWVTSHLGASVAKSALFVQDGKDKAKYATPDSILIDDRAKAIDPWVAAGGIGILHKSAEQTIKRLKELGV